MLFYVYQYVNPVTNLPFYIGKGQGKRAYDHLKMVKRNTDKNACTMFCEKLINSGIEPQIVFVHYDNDEDVIYDLESQLIKKYGRLGLEPDGILVNKSKGGKRNSGWHHTDETKNLMSKAKLGNSNHSDETKLLIAKNTSKALMDSPEARLKISQRHKGIPKSNEHAGKLKTNLTTINKDPVMLAKKLATKIANGTLNHSQDTKSLIAEKVKLAMQDPAIKDRMKASSKKRWADESQRANLGTKMAKTFKLTDKETNVTFIITNLAKYCRENKTHHRAVHEKFIVEKI